MPQIIVHLVVHVIPPPESPTSCRSEMVVGGGFEPPKALPADLQSAPFGRSGTPPEFKIYKKLLEPAKGLEPPTH